MVYWKFFLLKLLREVIFYGLIHSLRKELRKRFIYNSRIVIQTQLWESWGMNQTIEMFTINKNISFILNYSQSKLHHIVIHVLKFARC